MSENRFNDLFELFKRIKPTYQSDWLSKTGLILTDPFMTITSQTARQLSLRAGDTEFMVECGLPFFASPHCWFPNINFASDSGWAVFGVACSQDLFDYHLNDHNICLVNRYDVAMRDIDDYSPDEKIGIKGSPNYLSVASSFIQFGQALLAFNKLISSSSKVPVNAEVRSQDWFTEFSENLVQLDPPAFTPGAFWWKVIQACRDGQPLHEITFF